MKMCISTARKTINCNKKTTSKNTIVLRRANKSAQTAIWGTKIRSWPNLIYAQSFKWQANTRSKKEIKIKN